MRALATAPTGARFLDEAGEVALPVGLIDGFHRLGTALGVLARRRPIGMQGPCEAQEQAPQGALGRGVGRTGSRRKLRRFGLEQGLWRLRGVRIARGPAGGRPEREHLLLLELLVQRAHIAPVLPAQTARFQQIRKQAVDLLVERAQALGDGLDAAGHPDAELAQALAQVVHPLPLALDLTEQPPVLVEQSGEPRRGRAHRQRVVLCGGPAQAGQLRLIHRPTIADEKHRRTR